eukprot:CAMPEP_0195507744 /NCGR_PEP_ID=MMETSP0794_2-20130614/1134_1 /TAXON_ID=515487 /ORGANISM="Stephanopyxis turris, Strain CCMP 815" /LENGTH=814 /DNA_ID=CAMNT_0040634529 /DNA_START=204 /DNA_END=2646 /DNA_ORIENTATION=-
MFSRRIRQVLSKETNDSEPVSPSLATNGEPRKIECELASFEACVETCDALAASSSLVDGFTRTIIDDKGEDSFPCDCSVKVLPDGVLLLDQGDIPTIHDDEEDAIVVGYDGPGNDRSVNGFSARGWSPNAASLAIRHTVDSLQVTGTFAEELLISKKDSTGMISKACSKLSDAMIFNADSSKSKHFFPLNNQKKNARGSQQEINDLDQMTAAASNSSSIRMGPLFQPGTTILSALTSLEQYHSKSAERDSERLRRWSRSWMTDNALPTPSTTMKKPSNSFHYSSPATRKAHERSTKREAAISFANRVAKEAELRLNRRKAQAERKWAIVHEAEAEVNRKMEAIQKGIEREFQKGQAAAKNLDFSPAHMGLVTPEEISAKQQRELWEMVSKLSDVDGFAFSPTDLPQPVLPIPPPSSSRPTSPSLPPGPSRSAIEIEYHLPEKRLSALSADDAVEDAAGAFLNALSNLDTVYRSARIASEACLLSAANAQAKCIRSLVELEKKSLQERLLRIADLEKRVDEIDVRADLDMYIEMDKKNHGELYGTIGGEGDDGGIASALAVLNCHSQGIGTGIGVAGNVGSSVLEGWGSEEETGIVSQDEIESAIKQIFDINFVETTDKDKKETLSDLLEKNITFLVELVADPSTKSRTHRANVCYALNNLRSIQTEIKGEVQFEGLCRVFDSLLRGCGRDAGDIANAKMCIMLAQTFFTMNRDNDNASTKAEVDDPEDLSISEGSNGESDSIDRTQRTYIKSRLIDNPLFLDDDFWDQALFQCVSESLTQGGVMKNLQRAAMLVKSGELYDETNETKELKNIKW